MAYRKTVRRNGGKKKAGLRRSGLRRSGLRRSKKGGLSRRVKRGGRATACGQVCQANQDELAISSGTFRGEERL